MSETRETTALLAAPPKRPRLAVGWSLLILFGTAACVLDAVLIALEKSAGSPAGDTIDLVIVACALAQVQGAGCFLAMGQSGLWLRGPVALALCGLAATTSPFLNGFSFFTLLLIHALLVAIPLATSRLLGWRWIELKAPNRRTGQFRLGELFALMTLTALLFAAIRWDTQTLPAIAMASARFLPIVLLPCGLFMLVFRDASLALIAITYFALAALPMAILGVIDGSFSTRALMIGLMDGAVLLAAFGLVRACGYRLERAPSANQPPS